MCHSLIRFRSALLGLVGALLMGFAQAAPVLIPIGAEDDWAPFSSVKNGKPVGLAVDIVSAIFAEAGIPVQLVAVPYERCMKETLAGLLAGCFDSTPDAKLLRDYYFHAKPLFSDPTLILAPSAATQKALTVKDLRGKHVAITHGYTYGDEFESDKAIVRKVVPGDINALRMLAAGRVEYAIVYKGILAQLQRGAAASIKDQITPVGQVQMNNLFLSFSRSYPGSPELVRRFEVAHAKLVANGAIARILKRWE